MHAAAKPGRAVPGFAAACIAASCPCHASLQAKCRTVLPSLVVAASGASSNADVVERLLEEEAVVNVQSEDGATPLARAAACGNIKILDMLEAAGVRVDMRNASGMTPLAYSAALAQGNVKALETLIAKGANLHTRNQDGTMPLHQAATCGNQDIVTVLLTRGADTTAQDAAGHVGVLVDPIISTRMPTCHTMMLPAGVSYGSSLPS
ncbi:hypothetical protein ABBQ38_010978 [Trebouxia sp. C0009 RCD-2024]